MNKIMVALVVIHYQISKEFLVKAHAFAHFHFIIKLAMFNVNVYRLKPKISISACHYSCLGCSGPKDTDCLTCDNSTREYFLLNSTCMCIPSYI